MSAWSNWVGKFCFIAALAVSIALSGVSLPVSAQDQQDQQQPQQQPLNQQELAQLVAPIALYPDALLAQVLTRILILKKFLPFAHTRSGNNVISEAAHSLYAPLLVSRLL